MDMNIKQNSSKLFYEGACGSLQISGQSKINGLQCNSSLLTRLGIGATGLLSLSLLFTAGLMSIPSTAQAQEQAPQVEQVTVTGYRRALQNAIELKQDSDVIAEAISAEDIGKLPDVSIAESLGRLPGLASQRLNGRSQVISVRGLSPDFTTTLLNGRQQVSVGDNRGVEFDQYPSGLINNVLVYKTPEASLLGQGLAGTVDLRTIRPLEYGERAVSINARYIFNDQNALNYDGDDQGQRVNLFYADQFQDDTVGLALGISHLSNPSQGEQHRVWGYPTVGTGEFVSGGVDSLVRTSLLERNSFMAVVEWQPNEKISSALDIYYSDFSEENLLRGVEFGLQWGQGSLQPGYSTAGSFVSSGQYDDQGVLIRNDVENRTAELFAFGWNTEYSFDENWSAEIDLSYSDADRKDQIIESYSGLCDFQDTEANQSDACRPNVRFAYSNEGTRVYPEDSSGNSINYASFDDVVLTSPFGWGRDRVPGGQVGYLNAPDITDTLQQITLSAERQFDSRHFSQLDFGINYNNRQKAKIANEFFLSLGTDSSDQQITTAALPQTGQVTRLDFLGIPSGIASYDPRGLLSNGIYDRIRNSNDDVSAAKNWAVEEDVILPYARLGIDTQLRDMSLTGNVGVQIVYTDQSSTAPAAGAIEGVGVLGQTQGGREYVDVLPSLNLNLQLTENQYLRFGAARTLARPRMDELRASQELTITGDAINLTNDMLNPDIPEGVFWRAEGGNPNLEPWRANSVDLSYEFYFPNQNGYFAFAVYYKDLTSWVYTTNQEFDFSPLVPAVEAAIADFKAANPSDATIQALPDTPGSTIGPYNAPRNGVGGDIYGAEFSLTVNGDLFLPILEPFGIVFNYSLNQSAVQTTQGSPDVELPGLSDSIANVTVFFEKSGFSARVGTRYRSDFIGEIQGFGAGREFERVDAETVVDAQISYAFPEGNLFDGLSFFLQGTNLNNEPLIVYAGNDRNQVLRYEEYGATYLLGLGYKF